MLPGPAPATDSVHLPGFVDRLCPGELYCFELLVEPEYVAQVGTRITVGFARATRIYNPENFELTLALQNIVPGSHLRLPIAADATAGSGLYQASFIWIGD